MTLDEADKKEHPVETQWHYSIMQKYGFEPVTKSAIGFVRSYIYVGPNGRFMKVMTGVNSDYWIDQTEHTSGLWVELEPHLQKL